MQKSASITRAAEQGKESLVCVRNPPGGQTEHVQMTSAVRKSDQGKGGWVRESDTGKGEGVENSDNGADVICASPDLCMHGWGAHSGGREAAMEGGLRSVIGGRDKRGEHACALPRHPECPLWKKLQILCTRSGKHGKDGLRKFGDC